MNAPANMRLLYLTAEAWPTFRADVAVLFGKYLPRLGLSTDLLTERGPAGSSPALPWSGGKALLFDVPGVRSLFYPAKTGHLLIGLARADANCYDAIQVRDMPVIALFGLIAACLKRLPFFYWMSFPQSEGQVFRANARGPGAGLKYWFPLLQGTVGKWVLYKLVLPHADHVFVQSEQMVEDVAAYGINRSKMTPVPMGVDLEVSLVSNIHPIDDPRLTGKRVVVYLGTLDRARKIEVLFEMLAIARASCPDLVLLLVGDTEDAQHLAWLKGEAQRLGVAESVVWTGWVPTAQAWRYVRAAEVGLSPFPRGYLLDSASPTKAVEYMAIGLPVVVNDNPDQARVVAESGAGLCVPLTAQDFAEALVDLMSNSNRRIEMGQKGKEYIARTRGYDQLAGRLAAVYRAALETERQVV
jgi:glycosyltransferase involved in cell wall biosynthesis